MPVFVGTGDTSSRIRSNRVGFASHSANPGTASEGDVYFNSSDGGLRAYDGSAWSAVGAGGGTFSGIASGTLSNGQTVIIQSDGTVVGVSSTGSPATFGTAVVFESAEVADVSAAYDSSNGKVVIAYKDSGNANNGTAVVGTVSGTSISFGTPVNFNSGSFGTQNIAVAYDSSNEKVVIAFQDGNNQSYGRAIVGTVSGTSINFGSKTTFEATSNVAFIAITYDSSNSKIVIAYRDVGNSNYGTAIVGTVSGTSISFGSAAVFESANTQNISATYDSGNGKVVIAYRDYANSEYGTAVVGTVSGTSINFGSATVFESAVTRSISPVYDSINGKVVIAYRGGSNYGKAIVGNVSGTSINFGTAVVYESDTIVANGATYDSNSGKVVIAYSDNGNSEYGTLITGTVSGTSISFGSPTVFESAAIKLPVPTYDSSNKSVVVAYKDEGNSNYGTAIVFKDVSTNLTSENFIGFSDAAYSDGQTANIQIISSIDDAQSGLTTGSLHYVQTDGSLSTTAGTPSVEAGTALSDTKIRIKS